MKLGIHSDLHTEYSLCEISNLEELDVLVLAGDIGDLHTTAIFLEQTRKVAKNLPVLYVLGNHEYYGMHYPDAQEDYRKLCKKYEVTLLENETCQIGDILFLGATLWTDFQLAGQQKESMKWAGYAVNDFQKIYCHQKTSDDLCFTPEMACAEFKKTYDFLLAQLKEAKKKGLRTAVISHFLPATELIAPQFLQKSSSLMIAAYWVSDLSELFSYVDYWIYGHSHTNIETCPKNANTRFLCNQRGYSKTFNLFEASGYKHDYVITI